VSKKLSEIREKVKACTEQKDNKHRKDLKNLIEKFFSDCASDYGSENTYEKNKQVYAQWIEKIYMPILTGELNKAMIVGIKAVLKTTVTEYFMLLWMMIYPNKSMNIWKLDITESQEIADNIRYLVENNKKVASWGIKKGTKWTSLAFNLDTRKVKGNNATSLSFEADRWGKKADLNFVDDPQKPEHRHTKKEFERAWRVIRRMMKSGTKGTSTMIITMNRLFDDDIFERIVKMNEQLKEAGKEEWQIIQVKPLKQNYKSNQLPEIIRTINNRAETDFTFPEIWNGKTLSDAAIELEEDDLYSFIYCCKPRTGRAPFRNKYRLYEKWPENIVRVFNSVDPSHSVKEISNYSCSITIAEDAIGRYYIIDVLMRRNETPSEFCESIATRFNEVKSRIANPNGWLYEKFYVENNLGVFDELLITKVELMNYYCEIVSFKTAVNKESKIFGLESYFGAKLIYLPTFELVQKGNRGEDYGVFLEEVNKYPYIDHDDGLDALINGIRQNKCELVF